MAGGIVSKGNSENLTSEFFLITLVHLHLSVTVYPAGCLCSHNLLAISVR
jgi:hypothetical protein